MPVSAIPSESARAALGDSGPFAGEVLEVELLLSTGQVAALEAVAYQRGLTAGQLLRRLIRNFLKEVNAPLDVCLESAVQPVTPGTR